MKIQTILVLLLALFFLTAGCTQPPGNGTPTPTPSQTPAPTASPAETTGNFCAGYEKGLMSQEEMQNCTCPDGQKKFRCLGAAFCATESGKECKANEDCPEGEHCISDDGKNWYCTGGRCGCYHYDPKNPTSQICAD
ncbi:MAG: hypothetical protein V1493_03865 [Candidatus Diapherotrites archaeon]